MSNLYLLPSFLSPESQDHIPQSVISAINNTHIFIVERARTSRRFIRSIIKDYPLDTATFIELDKHNIAASINTIKEVFSARENIGLLSEAGTPCIADPGARVVNLAREAGYKIRPLTGPSSIILGLMASGMNGQQFSFYGYLPIKDGPLADKIRSISKQAVREGSTHIFIETPYRNDKLIKNLCRHLDHNLYLSAAINLNDPKEEIITLPIKKWKGKSIGKEQVIYCVGKLES